MAKKKVKPAAAKPAPKKPQAKPQQPKSAPAPKPQPPVVAKPTQAEIDDLLGAAPAAAPPVAAAPKPPRSTSAPVIGAGGKVMERPCRASCGGTIALYDREKGAAWIPGTHRWAIRHEPSMLTKSMEQKRPARKLMALAAKGGVPELLPQGAAPATGDAPRGRKPKPAAAPSVPGAPAAPPPVVATGMDEDFGKPSEASPYKVPSVWIKDRTRFGLLVYYGRSRAKLVAIESGTVAVHKIATDDLMPAMQYAIMRDKLRNSQDEKQIAELTKVANRVWCPASGPHETVQHIVDVWSKSTLAKTEAARAYLDQILGAADDALLAATEEDLLS
jgi:hypothetical protein